MLPGWSRESVAGKPADVFHPPGSERPRSAVLFLHAVGLESPADNAAYTAELARHGLACCARTGRGRGGPTGSARSSTRA